MKKTILLLASVLATSALSFAQSAAQPNAQPPSTATLTTDKPHETTFDLDFPGGTPRQLADAIEKASGRPVNLVIPAEYADWQLPPLKMRHVTTSYLFRAIEQAPAAKHTSTGRLQSTVGLSFRAAGGTEPDDTVWSFGVNQNWASEPSKTVHYYALAPYLERGLTVDDISTAIQTGWRMRGDNPVPALSFHKETKLLIAVGDPAGLEVVDSVLRALDSAKPKAHPADADKAVADPKTKS